MAIKNLYSWIFLFIFFAKMVIAAAPLISDHLRADCLNAVIMQIEIEQEAKEEVKGKGLQEYTLRIPTFVFASSSVLLHRGPLVQKRDRHLRTFYPSVPTPPPNA
ncbi:MAG TPA: hypothetical protein VGE15_05945 [Sphingobacteriaceae bacterium]